MTLLKSIQNKLPKQMYLPTELIMLFEWIEEKGFLSAKNNEFKGYLLDYKMEEYKGIYFSAENRELWHFKENSQAKERFFPIAYIDDSDGCIGLWLDDKGKQHIVWIGSEYSSPMPFCTCPEPLTLLKLLAIGYNTLAKKAPAKAKL